MNEDDLYRAWIIIMGFMVLLLITVLIILIISFYVHFNYVNVPIEEVIT